VGDKGGGREGLLKKIFSNLSKLSFG
jgi:hypothetical protein